MPSEARQEQKGSNARGGLDQSCISIPCIPFCGRKERLYWWHKYITDTPITKISLLETLVNISNNYTDIHKRIQGAQISSSSRNKSIPCTCMYPLELTSFLLLFCHHPFFPLLLRRREQPLSRFRLSFIHATSTKGLCYNELFEIREQTVAKYISGQGCWRAPEAFFHSGMQSIHFFFHPSIPFFLTLFRLKCCPSDLYLTIRLSVQHEQN